MKGQKVTEQTFYSALIGCRDSKIICSYFKNETNLPRESLTKQDLVYFRAIFKTLYEEFDAEIKIIDSWDDDIKFQINEMTKREQNDH